MYNLLQIAARSELYLEMVACLKCAEVTKFVCFTYVWLLDNDTHILQLITFQ